MYRSIPSGNTTVWVPTTCDNLGRIRSDINIWPAIENETDFRYISATLTTSDTSKRRARARARVFRRGYDEPHRITTSRMASIQRHKLRTGDDRICRRLFCLSTRNDETMASTPDVPTDLLRTNTARDNGDCRAPGWRTDGYGIYISTLLLCRSIAKLSFMRDYSLPIYNTHCISIEFDRPRFFLMK